MGRQKMIEGTVDVVDQEVQVKAEAYVKLKRRVADDREKMNAALDVLVLAMQEANVTELLVDGGDNRLILDTKTGVKIEARKANKELYP